jgi:MarR family 2-MHQ and catechol resistance regulon transcriptional repressor
METNIIDALYETYRIIETIINKNLKVGITIHELHIIQTLKKLMETNENTNSILAQKLYIKVSAATLAVSGLVDKGYLIRVEDIKDKRIIYIELTAKGNQVVKTINKQHDEIITEINKHLKLNNLEVLKTTFTQYYSIIKKYKASILNSVHY